MKVEQAIGFKKKVNHFSEDASLPLPLELMGIELEYEGVSHSRNNTPNLWTAVEDGSLRNNGIEYVFSEPLYGTGIRDALDAMQEHVDSISPCVSSRTSVHVHLNVSDMDVDQLMTLIILYLIFEKAIVSYHGGMREDNIFCVPYYKAPDALAQLMHIFQYPEDTSGNDVNYILSSFAKYYGLNIGAVVQHGSLEFRHMAGCTDMSKVKEWVCIIQQLKLTALHTGSNYMELITNMSGNSSFITSEVFGDFADALAPYVTVVDLMQGARLAQRMVNGHHLTEATNVESKRRTNKKTSAKIDVVRERVQKKRKKPEKKKSVEAEELTIGATYVVPDNFYSAPTGLHTPAPMPIAPPPVEEWGASFGEDTVVPTTDTLEERFRQYILNRDGGTE